MFRQHVSQLLSAYCMDELATEEARRVAEHLLACARCRSEYEEIKLGVAFARELPEAQAPDAIWQGIEASLEQAHADGKTAVIKSRPRFALFATWPRIAVVSFASLLVAALVGGWLYLRPPAAAWEVARLTGSPRIGSERMNQTGRLAVGEWLETDAGSRAQIQVARIGQVEIEPQTRVRLIETRATEHRLELARGTLHARIYAPPRLFFVDTPSAVAADLGCAYTLEVDDAGRSLLHVTAGWVALERGARESVVPAGAACATAPGLGPGTPYFEDASDKFLNALDAFDFKQGGDDALNVVIAEARLRDTLTLWHLLPRVDDVRRVRVYERLAQLAPPPAGVTRDAVLRLDEQALELWKNDLQDKWLHESFPAARKVWRRIWQ
jgi:ferric-dicitrate binding protein FerR (iron transport regulator)